MSLDKNLIQAAMGNQYKSMSSDVPLHFATFVEVSLSMRQDLLEIEIIAFRKTWVSYWDMAWYTCWTGQNNMTKR